MMQYQVTVSGQKLTITLDCTQPNQNGLIQYEGDETAIEEFKEWLEEQYGAFGHIMSSDVGNPIDLRSVMSREDAQQYQPVLLKGQEIVQKYDPGIPDGAVT